MSEIQEEEVVVSQTMTTKDEAAKTNALIAYGLMVVGLFTGIFLDCWCYLWAMIKKMKLKVQSLKITIPILPKPFGGGS